jgi:hypothetical protein
MRYGAGFNSKLSHGYFSLNSSRAGMFTLRKFPGYDNAARNKKLFLEMARARLADSDF